MSALAALAALTALSTEAETSPAGQVTAAAVADEDLQPGQANLPADGSETGLMAFRPEIEPVNGDGPEPGLLAAEYQSADVRAAERPRPHRHAGGHAPHRSARQRSAGPTAGRDPVPSAKPAAASPAGDRGQDGRDRNGLAAMAGDLAGWASGELPGQASRQLAPWTVTYRDHGDADPANGETRVDRVI